MVSPASMTSAMISVVVMGSDMPSVVVHSIVLNSGLLTAAEGAVMNLRARHLTDALET